MMQKEVQTTLGSVNVKTTERRGHTPEEIAESAIRRIISISEDADPILRQQAEAFQDRTFQILVAAIKQGIQSDRTTLYNMFYDQGHKDMAEILRTL